MITKPAKVKPNEISSVDVVKFDGGLFLGGAQNAPINAFVASKDVELDHNGYIIPRRKLSPFLPDTVETTYQKFPVLWQGEIFYFTADDGKIKFCQDSDSSWSDCGGDNSFTTNNGGMCKFLRALDTVLILNGKNGDKLAYIDLTDSGFAITKYAAVTDPTTAFTKTLTGLSAGSFNVYYAYSYTGAIGETLLSDILTVSVDHVRDQWSSLGTPGSIDLVRPAAPTGAKYWNVYVATAALGGTIQDSDMLQIATKLDLSTTHFIDNGTLDINLGSVAPIANSTDGPKVDQGLVEDGTPILWGDQDNPYNIWIGGSGPYALDFSISNGGYTAEPEKGTNFYPTTIIGFRTGQGVPALTVLYSNTEGLSKQAVLQQQNVTYGDTTFSVWGVTEQHYGAAGVAAPNSAVNYNGKLLFLSTDGFMSMETQPTVQNVLSTSPISGPIDSYVRSIRNSAMETVVGLGWNNKFMWCVPNSGFETPQQILVFDTNNKGIVGSGAWYTMDIPANWVGVVSPQDSAAFVYICQGNKSYKLLDSDATTDTKSGLNVPFSTNARGALVPFGGPAHNTWQAEVQAMFYILGLVGDITVGVTYRNQNGTLKTKSKVYAGPTLTPSIAGGWGDPQWTYANFDQIGGWIGWPEIIDNFAVNNAVDVRIPVRIDDIANEAQWFFSTDIGYNNFKLRSVSFEGINLGIRPDLQ